MVGGGRRTVDGLVAMDLRRSKITVAGWGCRLAMDLRANDGEILGSHPGVPKLNERPTSNRQTTIDDAVVSVIYWFYHTMVQRLDAAQTVAFSYHLHLRAPAGVKHCYLVLRLPFHNLPGLLLCYDYALLPAFHFPPSRDHSDLPE